MTEHVIDGNGIEELHVLLHTAAPGDTIIVRSDVMRELAEAGSRDIRGRSDLYIRTRKIGA